MASRALELLLCLLLLSKDEQRAWGALNSHDKFAIDPMREAFLANQLL